MAWEMGNVPSSFPTTKTVSNSLPFAGVNGHEIHQKSPIGGRPFLQIGHKRRIVHETTQRRLLHHDFHGLIVRRELALI